MYKCVGKKPKTILQKEILLLLLLLLTATTTTTTTTTTTIIIIIIIRTIIIALKGAIRDFFLQSLYCSANRLRHVRSTDQSSIVCKKNKQTKTKTKQKQNKTV